MKVLIRPDGKIEMVYTDALDLRPLGTAEIRRASYVEPDKDGNWVVDMSPSGGDRLGPYKFRAEALRSEAEWLQRKFGL